MSDTLCIGTITKLESGRFDNQYDVEITTVAGEKVATYDGISVYEKKKDGSDAKVWPLVKKSYMDKVPFAWTGNTRQSDTKAGPKTYATITWATTVDEIFEGPSGSSGNGEGGGEGNGSSDAWGSVSTAPEPATPPAASPAPQQTHATDWDERGVQMEAAWAVKAVLDRTPNDVDISHSDLVDAAIKLAMLKRQVASEIGS